MLFPRLLPVSLALLLLAAAPRAMAQPATPSPCIEDERLGSLDFWVGSWEVYSNGELVGVNRIEKILEGCALLEHWQANSGGRGKSLFYFYPAEQRWKQVWITENPFASGGIKEKAQITGTGVDTVRFQGEVRTANGSSYLDRTTLTALDSGEVLQVIEISPDGGSSWREVFRGLYRHTDR